MLLIVAYCNAQNEELYPKGQYQINTLENEIDYYVKNEKYNCALSLIKSSDSFILNEVNTLLIADVFLNNEDTVNFEKYIYKFY